MADELEELFADEVCSPTKTVNIALPVYLPSNKSNASRVLSPKEAKSDIISSVRPKSSNYDNFRKAEMIQRRQNQIAPVSAYRSAYGNIFTEDFLLLKQSKLGTQTWNYFWIVLYATSLVLFSDELSVDPLMVLLIGSGSDFLFSTSEVASHSVVYCDDVEFHFIIRKRICKCTRIDRSNSSPRCHTILATLKAKNLTQACGWLAASKNALSSCFYKKCTDPLTGQLLSFKYTSSFPVRNSGNLASFFIDGQEAFAAIAKAIQSARKEILITSWWLSPDFLLMRGGANESCGKFLTVKALLAFAMQQNNVHVFILHFRESAIALAHDSSYTKTELLNLNSAHEFGGKMSVIRHPWSATGFWSHHEKLVIVDRRLAFFGGLDMTYGRFDDAQHRVWMDETSSNINQYPALDYYNPRLCDFVDVVKNSNKSLVNTDSEARMPWHDVHCVVSGSCVIDLARHFVERWNHAVRTSPRQASGDKMADLPILIPTSTVAFGGITSDDVVAHSQLTEGVSVFSPHLGFVRSSLMMCQVVRSVCDWSAGSVRGNDASDPSCCFFDAKDDGGLSENCLMESCEPSGATENSILNAYIRMIDESKSFIYIENQYFVSAIPSDGNLAIDIRVDPSASSFNENERQFEEDEMENSVSIDIQLLDEKESLLAQVRREARIVRNCPSCSADCEVQNKIALALCLRLKRAMIEDSMSLDLFTAKSPSFLCVYVLPVIPSFQGDAFSSGTNKAIMQAQCSTIRWIYEALASFESPNLKVSDYISFYTLRNYASISILLDSSNLSAPLPGEAAITSSLVGDKLETFKLIQEEIYTHSKLMIVDDCKMIIGSSNINDRSMLGNRDSEIGVVMEDVDFIQIDDKKVGRFCHSLRVHLWAEHFGLLDDQNQPNPINELSAVPIDGSSILAMAYLRDALLQVVDTDTKEEIASFFRFTEALRSWSCADKAITADDVRNPQPSPKRNKLFRLAARNAAIYSACFPKVPSNSTSSFQDAQEKLAEGIISSFVRSLACAKSIGFFIDFEEEANIFSLMPKLSDFAMAIVSTHVKMLLLSKIQGHITSYPYLYLKNQSSAPLTLESFIPRKVFL